MTSDRKESLERLASFFARTFDRAVQSHGLNSVETREVQDAFQEAGMTLHFCAPTDWREVFEAAFYTASAVQRSLRAQPETEDTWDEGLADA